MQLDVLIGIYVAVFGLIVGSYLNVVIYRLPLGKSTVLPRSRCPSCDAPIRALDNLPVVSWLLLRGRCRDCGSGISWRYPLIEALTAVLFVACFRAFGLQPDALIAVVFGCLMIVLAMIDFDHMILPDRITWPGIGIGLLAWLGMGWLHGRVRPYLLDAVLGALLGGGLILAIWGLWYLIRKEEGMGLGDAKMLALIGAFLGWRSVLVSFFLAVLVGSVAGIALMGRSGEGMKMRLPFGFFLALGGLAALFAGPQLIAAYVRLL